MNLMTFIARVNDGMLLVVSDNAFNIQYKNYALEIIKNITDNNPNNPSRCSINIDEKINFHYAIEQGICYLTLTEKPYPKYQAFQYIEALYNQFLTTYTNDDINQFSRPYAAIDFDVNLSTLKRQYLTIQNNSSKTTNKIQAELNETYNIMVQNISDIMKRGEKLKDITSLGTNLLKDSKKFNKKAKTINRNAYYKSLIPIIVIIMLIIMVIYFRFF